MQLDTNARMDQRQRIHLLNLPASTGRKRRVEQVSASGDGTSWTRNLTDSLFLILLDNPGRVACYANQGVAGYLAIGSFVQCLGSPELRDNPDCAIMIELANLQPGIVGSTARLRRQVSQFSEIPEFNSNVQMDVHEFIIHLFDMMGQDVRSRSVLHKLCFFEEQVTYKSANGICADFTPAQNTTHYPVVCLPILSGYQTLQDLFRDRHSDLTEVNCATCQTSHSFLPNTSKILKKPAVLSIALKRYDEHGRKIENPVDVALRWRPFNDDTEYVLVAANIHHGTNVKQGHYKSLIVDPLRKLAYELSDAKEPLAIREEGILKDKLRRGYIYHYEDIKNFSKRSETRSPVKKMACTTLPDMNAPVRRRVLSHEEKQEQMISSLLKKEHRPFDVAKLDKKEVEMLIKKLGLWNQTVKGDSKQLRGLLASNLHKIFKEKAPRTYVGLCKHYGVDAEKLEADASGGQVEKVKTVLERMSNSVKHMFRQGSKPDDLSFNDTVENIVTLLTRLEDGSLKVENKKAIYLALKGEENRDFHRHLDRLTPSLKRELVKKLILKIDIPKMREILDEFPMVTQQTNNDRTAGQLQSLALDNSTALARIISELSLEDLLADVRANSKARQIKFLQKLQHTKKLSPAAVDMLYEEVCGKASSPNITVEKNVTSIRRKLLQKLVYPMHTPNVLAILGHHVVTPPAEAAHDELIELVLRNKPALDHLFDYIQQKSSSLPSTPAKVGERQVHEGSRVVTYNVDQITETMEKQLSVSKKAPETESQDESSATDSQDESITDDWVFDSSNAGICKLLHDLEHKSLPVSLKKLHQHLTGRKEKNKSRWLPQVKENLVQRLISQLTLAQKRDILKQVPGVKVHKHNDKIDGQIQSLALKDNRVIASIMDVLDSSEGQSDSSGETEPTDFDLLHRLDEEELEDWEVSKIWLKLFGRPITDRQLRTLSASKKAMRKEVMSKLVAVLSEDEVYEILKYFKIKPQALEKTQQQLVNVCLKRPETLQYLKQFLDHRDTASTGTSVTGAGAQPLLDASVDMGETSQLEMEESVLTEVHYSPEDSAEHLSQNDILDTYSNEDLKAIYENYGGRQHAARRPAMIQFIRNKALDSILNGIPKYLLAEIPHDHNMKVERTSQIRSAIKERAKKDATFMRALIDLYEENPKDNFNRTNTSAAHASFDITKRIRLKRTQFLNEDGEFYLLPNGTPRNPLIEAGKKVETEMAQLQFETCSRCRESRLNSGVSVESGLCRRCAQEQFIPNVPFQWSEQNNMLPGPIPLELRDLTRIEMAAISAYRVVMTIIRLKGGGTKTKGHAITFGQDIPSLADKLPRLPSDIAIIYLKSPHRDMELRARKNKILRAIQWLMAHNQYYRENCRLSLENLDQYPEDGVVEGVATMALPMNSEQEPQPDQEPASAEDCTDTSDHHGAAEEGYGEFFESCANQAVPVEATNERIFDGLMNARAEHPDIEDRPDSPVRRHEDSPAGDERVVLDFPTRSENPMSEFSEGFFTLAYPWLFPTGAGDISCPRDGKQPKMVEWINHLLWLAEEDGTANRFAKDATFVFHAVNMRQRQQAMMLGTIFADRVLTDKNVSEVKEMIQDKESPILRSLMHFTSTIAGSNAHMASMRKNVIAATRNVQIMSNNQERYNVFFTFSFPDFHLRDLHRLLPGHEEYLDKTVVPVWEEGLDRNLFIDKKSDYDLRAKAVSENGHIVNEYIHIKLQHLINTILTQHLGVVDLVVRSEFQSRSAIHFHAIARCRGVSLDDLELSFKKHLIVEDFRAELAERNPLAPESVIDKAVKEEIEEFNKKGFWVLEDEEEIGEMRARKARVVDFAVNMMGISGMNPITDAREWAPPEGLNPHPPPNNALRSSIRQVERDPDLTLNEDYCALVQRVMLHTCRKNYCYPADAQFPVCRFKYPFSLQGFRAGDSEVIGDGEQSRTFFPIYRDQGTMQSGAKIEECELKYLRNHGRIVQAIPELLSFWRGNIDVKVIKNVGTLINYIGMYSKKLKI